MAIELALAYIPCAKMTEERIKILHESLDGITDDELQFDTEFDTREEIVELLHYQIEVLRDAEDYWRHVNHIILPNLPYVLLAAGGYTFDESPSELYETFLRIESCQPLLTKLVDWAVEDFDSKDFRQFS